MAAPPPYDFKTAPLAPLPSQFLEKNPQQRPIQQAPPQSYRQHPPPSLAQPRLLHIYLDGLTHRHLTVRDSDKLTPLYTVATNSGTIFSSKPHMRIFRGGTSPETATPIGTADFHTYSRTVDLTVHGRAVTMDPSGLFTRAHQFRSSIGALKWEGNGVFSNDLVLVNERNEWIAKFHNSKFSMGKEGKLEISNGNLTEAFLDEVVVSGLAMVEHERRSRGE